MAITPWKSAFLLHNPSATDQNQGRVRALKDGGFVGAWQDGDDIVLRIFNADGTERVAQFPISTVLESRKSSPSFAVLSNGNFAISWNDTRAAGDQIDVRAQIFTPKGDKVGDEFLVNSSTLGVQAQSSMTALKSGGFAVTFLSQHADGTDNPGILTRVFDADGAALGGDKRVNTTTAGGQETAATAGLKDGGYVAIFVDNNGASADIRGRILKSDGTADDADFLISDGVDTDAKPSVALLTDGRFIVTWESDGGEDGDDACILARIYNADGTAFGDQFVVNTISEGDQVIPTVAALNDGGFAISYQSFDGSNSYRLITFSASGTQTDEQTIVSDAGNYLGNSAFVTVLADGRLVMAWDEIAPDEGGDPLDDEVYAQILDPRKAGISMSGTNGDDRYVGTSFNDVLNGADGDDHLTGGGGNDVLNGGAGRDTLIGGSGNDVYYLTPGDAVVEMKGGGYDVIVVGYSAALGNDTEVEVLQAASGAAAISLSGANMNDTLIGNDGANTLNGGTGADTMTGGGGSDTYHVDQGGDVVTEAAGGGADTVVTTISYTLASYLENLTAAGSAGLTLSGNDLANTIIGNDGANVIDGDHGADTMMGGGGDDIYRVDNAGDVINDSGGTDTVITAVSYSVHGGIENLKAAAGTAALTLVGDNLANLLVGNNGRNTLKGNAGNDRLYGGLGNDVLTGGKGKDIFVFDKAPNKKSNFDKITDFNVKDDTIWLDNAVFKKLGKGTEKKPGKLDKKFFTLSDKAKDKDDYLFYDAKKGILFYDADGSGKGKAVEIASLTKKLKLTVADFGVI